MRFFFIFGIERVKGSRRLGRSDLEVVLPFCFGQAMLYGWTADDREDLLRPFSTALSQPGFNYSSTRRTHIRAGCRATRAASLQRSSGRWLMKQRGNRDKVIVATRSAPDVGSGRNHWRPSDRCRKAVEVLIRY
jgi:aryl-alcohol dehydrogenase-like predicted oxidoreductase